MGENQTTLTPATTAVRSLRLNALTGMRFYAALMVVLTHVTHNFLPREFGEFFAMGGVGVSFFFMLSGFVLIWSRKDGQSKAHFYRNRFARVYPLHALTWAAAGVLFLVTQGTLDLPVALATMVLLQSWIPFEKFFFGMNGPSWSLSCEAFFYAVFPFMASRVCGLSVKSLGRMVVGLYIAVGLITLAAHVALQDGPTVALLYVNPLYRLWEFVIGMALARLILSGWRMPLNLRVVVNLTVLAFVGVSLLNVAIALNVGIFAKLPMAGLPTDLASLVLVPFFALLITASATSELSGKSSHLQTRALVRLGNWSFALYVSHLLLVEITKALLPDGLPVAGGMAVCVLLVLVAIGLSGLLYRFVEHPFEARIRSPRPATSRGMAAS